METVFLICAILGGTLVVCQVVAGLVGIGGDHDIDHGTDHEPGGGDHGNWFLGMLSVRAVTSALLFFGLGGMTALYYGVDEPAAFGIAIGGGSGHALRRRRADALAGAAQARRHDPRRALGRPHRHRLPAAYPAARAGSGKIHLMLQNRTVEYQAVTPGSELATGTPIRVVAVVNSDTVEVEAAYNRSGGQESGDRGRKEVGQ